MVNVKIHMLGSQ